MSVFHSSCFTHCPLFVVFVIEIGRFQCVACKGGVLRKLHLFSSCPGCFIWKIRCDLMTTFLRCKIGSSLYYIRARVYCGNSKTWFLKFPEKYWIWFKDFLYICTRLIKKTFTSFLIIFKGFK